jgi:predicted outer membrane protein
VQNRTGLREEIETFANDAYQNTMLELALCNLAEAKAVHKNVQKFAGLILEENDTINEPLFQVTDRNKILLLADLRPEYQKELSALQSVKAPDFDRMFLKAVAKNYQLAISLYQNKLPKTDIVELKQFNDIMLSIKQDHLEQAQRFLDQID